ncbi:TetR family transcriptional regulator, partial [Staphylococcus carnosus]
MQKEDLRVIKTKMNIENAFLNLFYQKEIEQISVKEITTIAQIARKTFYLHY